MLANESSSGSLHFELEINSKNFIYIYICGVCVVLMNSINDLTNILCRLIPIIIKIA